MLYRFLSQKKPSIQSKLKALTGFALVSGLSLVPLAAHAKDWDGVTMNFFQSGTISADDCIDPPRASDGNYWADFYRATSSGTISLYMDDGGLNDPYLEILDSDAATLLASNDDGGDQLDSFIKNFDIDTGDYILATTFSKEETGSYTLYSNIALSLVSECPQIIEENIPSTTVYGTPASFTAEASSGLSVSIAASPSSVCAVTDSTGPQFVVSTVAVGTCTVTLSQAGDSNFTPAVNVVKSFSVTAKTLGLTGLSAGKTYDGTTLATVTGTPALSGIVSGDNVALGGSATTGTFSSAAAGNRTVSVSGLSLTGDDASNYSLNNQISATISKIALTATFVADLTKVYNGTTSFPLNTESFELSGVVEGETVTVTNSNGVLGAADVGTQTLTVTTPTLGGGDQVNYTLAGPITGTAEVAPKSLTLGGTFDVEDKEEDGTNVATVATQALTLTGLVSGETDVSVGGALAIFASTEPGDDLVVTLTSVSLLGDQSANYVVDLTGAPTALGNISLPLIPPPPPPYYGPLVTNLSMLELASGAQKTITIEGVRLDTVTSGSVDGKSITIIRSSESELVVLLPVLTAGIKDLVLLSASGELTHQDAFSVVAPSSTIAETSTDAKVNAGSFKGYVAVYAKDYEGKRLSAKIGNDWIIVPALASNFERVTDFTGAGVDIAVRIYIDRVLIDTINLVTK